MTPVGFWVSSVSVSGSENMFKREQREGGYFSSSSWFCIVWGFRRNLHPKSFFCWYYLSFRSKVSLIGLISLKGRLLSEFAC